MPPCFDPNSYGPVMAGLLTGAPLAPLDAGTPHEKMRAALAALTPETLFAHAGQPVRDGNMARACLAGLWLRHNFFDESHTLSQEIETPTGSFWHAILHRREPDYSNARYWFRRVGVHPIYPALAEAAGEAGWMKTSRWDTLAFVDRVEMACAGKTDREDVELCETVQQIEWELLFDFSWKQALGC